MPEHIHRVHPGHQNETQIPTILYELMHIKYKEELAMGRPKEQIPPQSHLSHTVSAEVASSSAQKRKALGELSPTPKAKISRTV